MATASRQQVPWTAPRGNTAHPKFRIYNSLTRSKVPFVPLDAEGKRVTCTDILRRILRNYFEFDVKFVMNITDVDDKIILRARQQHLLEEYIKLHTHVDDQVLDLADTAYRRYISKNLPLIEQDPVPSPKEFQAAAQKSYGKVVMAKFYKEKQWSQVLGDSPSPDPDIFYSAVQDILYPLLDEQGGSKIKGDDHAIFTKLTKKFEDRFFRDVRELNVMDPDELTRMTEFGPEIAAFVNKIVENHFGYSTPDGSVYFDIDTFEKAGNSYAKLEPWNRTNKELQADGEGALSQKTTEKRSPADFAIWKASKPGEPSWPSTRGPGRPGWHIECSAMASAKLGKQMDIHSGS